MSLLSRTKKLLGQEEKKSSKKKAKTSEATKTESATTATSEALAGSVMASAIGLNVIISEKSMSKQMTDSIVTFRVRPEATKGQIAKAIVERYGVTPLGIRTVSGKPKRRRRGMTQGSTNAWKKAYVKVEDVQAFNVAP